MNFLAIEPDAHVGSDEVEKLLDGIYDAVGIEPPFLLVVVSHAYISRRLACAFRKHLPANVGYFPCPPYDLDKAHKEELPRFGTQVLQEARRLYFLGADFNPEAKEAFNKLNPGWMEKKKGVQETAVKHKKDEKNALDQWQLAFKATVEPFPAFNEVDRLLGGGRKGHAVVVGWGAAVDSAVKSRCFPSLKAVGSSKLILTGTQDTGHTSCGEEHFFALDPDDHV